MTVTRCATDCRRDGVRGELALLHNGRRLDARLRARRHVCARGFQRGQQEEGQERFQRPVTQRDAMRL